METKTLKQMKASEIHRIVAAVLEVVEKAGFEPQVDVTLQLCKEKEAKEEQSEKWKMAFQKENTNLDELNAVKGELGANFKVIIEAKDKTSLLISIEAPSEDFIALLQKRPVHVPPQRTMFDNAGQGGEQK